MAWVYRYIDLADEIIKYIGIVWGKTRTLKARINEHKKEPWYIGKRWRIEYITENIDNRSEAEAFESHYVSLYNPCFNVSKVGWGINKYLPDRENDWVVYNPKDFKDIAKDTRAKKSRPQNKKVIKKDPIDYFEKNKKSIPLLEYIFDKLFSADFYITQLNKNNYSVGKHFRQEYSIIIESPFPEHEKIEEINYMIFKNECLVLVPTMRKHTNNLELILGTELDDNDRLFDAANDLYKEANIKFCNTIPDDILILKNKADYLLKHWQEVVDINKPELYKEPPEDYGKYIKKPNDIIFDKNNDYFWQWYIGCSLIYTDGGAYYIYNNGKLSEPIFNYSNDYQRKYLFEHKKYSLEKYTDYYLNHWAIDLDKVVWVTSIGGIFLGDEIWHFNETGNMQNDIDIVLATLESKNIKSGIGMLH